MVCLAKYFLAKEPSQIVPIDGTCPVGNHTLLWGNLLAFKHGILPVRIKSIANIVELIISRHPIIHGQVSTFCNVYVWETPIIHIINPVFSPDHQVSRTATWSNVVISMYCTLAEEKNYRNKRLSIFFHITKLHNSGCILNFVCVLFCVRANWGTCPNWQCVDGGHPISGLYITWVDVCSR